MHRWPFTKAYSGLLLAHYCHRFLCDVTDIPKARLDLTNLRPRDLQDVFQASDKNATCFYWLRNQLCICLFYAYSCIDGFWWIQWEVWQMRQHHCWLHVYCLWSSSVHFLPFWTCSHRQSFAWVLTNTHRNKMEFYGHFHPTGVYSSFIRCSFHLFTNVYEPNRRKRPQCRSHYFLLSLHHYP